MTKILIGRGVTDANGVATMTEDANGNPVNGYVGTGAGLVDLSAGVTIDGRTFQSEICSVFDVKQNVDSNSDWYTQSGTVTQNTNGDWVTDGYHFIYNPDVPSSQYGWSGNLTLEFEVVSNTTGAVQFYNTSANFTQRLTVFGATTGSKVKLVFDGSKITPIVDGVTKTSYDFNPTGLFRIGFVNSLTLKNIVIY